MTRKLLLASAVAAVAIMPVAAQAQTVTTTTVVTQRDIPDAEKVDFAALDLNGDGILSREEVGEKLFKIFDRDGNHVLDNIEFERRSVITIVPMEKHILTKIDMDDTGTADETLYSHEMFLKESLLARFDKNMDGLSPREFIGKSFLQLDINKSKAIELDEWKSVYKKSRAPLSANQAIYNQ